MDDEVTVGVTVKIQTMRLGMMKYSLHIKMLELRYLVEELENVTQITARQFFVIPRDSSKSLQCSS